MKKIFILTLSTFSALSFADTNQCSNIQECIELVSKLTQKKYFIDKDVKGAVNTSKNYKITKKNADQFLSHTLFINGYTRIPLDDETWSVINSRDVRYAASPSYEYPSDKIPHTHDYITVSVKLKNPYIAQEVTRNFRPFLSRYGRVVDIAPDHLIIADTGVNIHRFITFIKRLDKKPSEEEVENYQKEKKHKRKLKEIQSRHCSSKKINR